METFFEFFLSMRSWAVQVEWLLFQLSTPNDFKACGCSFEFHILTNGRRCAGNEAAFEKRGFDLEGD